MIQSVSTPAKLEILIIVSDMAGQRRWVAVFSLTVLCILLYIQLATLPGGYTSVSRKGKGQGLLHRCLECGVNAIIIFTLHVVTYDTFTAMALALYINAYFFPTAISKFRKFF